MLQEMDKMEDARKKSKVEGDNEQQKVRLFSTRFTLGQLHGDYLMQCLLHAQTHWLSAA